MLILFQCKKHCWCGIQGRLLGYRQKLIFLGNDFFLGNGSHLDSRSTMLQQYHWITGWWQPTCEQPLSFVEDDKQRPGEDVTSSERRCKNSIKKSNCEISNMHIQDGRPGRYENRRRSKKGRKSTPYSPRGVHTAIEVSPKSPCGAIALGRRPS